MEAGLVATAALVGVCALAVAALRLVGRRGAVGRALRLRAHLPLGARRSVYVIDAGGRSFLVGAGDGALSLLAELDPKELPDGAPAAAPFAEALRSLVGSRR
jgi:flagellar biogenesis protein FliO